MGAFANITINDGAVTPVSHTFAPVRIDPQGVAKYADRVGGIAIGYPVLTAGLREPTKTSRAYKLTYKVVVPTLEQTSASTASGIQPAPTKAYDCLAVVEIILPERSTLLERQHLIAYLKNFLGGPVITSAVEDFETVY